MSALPATVTQTANGRNLYVLDGNVDQDSNALVFAGTASVTTGGTIVADFADLLYNGEKIVPGSYIVYMNIPAVGYSVTNFTSACFPLYWDGATLFCGGVAFIANGSTGDTTFGVRPITNVTSGLASVMSVSVTNLAGATPGTFSVAVRSLVSS
jgi:hypothetical protein